ncbi:MAG: hypothetical protein PF692_05075 [Kiritimatiellae bacterium]|jgi:hypothetical protein|nr:hypothetical protein [Kiritimatiellia bacterium]
MNRILVKEIDMIKLLVGTVLALVIVTVCVAACPSGLCTLPSTTTTTTNTTTTTTGLCMLPATTTTTGTPVMLDLKIQSASADVGAKSTIRISNVGDSPYTLYACPSMTLCCIKDLHIMLGSSETAISLLDVCKAKKPVQHEVFLPIGATFEFDVTIPSDYFPVGSTQPGEALVIQLCLELTDGTRLCSEAKTAKLK